MKNRLKWKNLNFPKNMKIHNKSYTQKTNTSHNAFEKPEIREHVFTTKRISAEFLFSRFTTEMKRSNGRIMLLGTVAVGAQRS